MRAALKNFNSPLLRFAITSSLFYALVTSTDNLILKQVIVLPQASSTALLAYLILGSWVGVLTQFIFSNLIGRFIAPDFKPIHFIALRQQKNAIISGFFSALATAFALRGNQLADPSVVLVLFNIVIVYLIFWDWRRGRITYRNVALPAIIIVTGSALASVGEHFEINWTILMVLLVGFGLPSAISELFDQNEQQMQKQLDPVTYSFWRFIWLAIWGTFGTTMWLVFSGQVAEFTQFVFTIAPYASGPIIVLMLFVTIANATKNAARRIDEASVIALLATLQVVFVFPITILGDVLQPGLFGPLPTTWWVWFLRVFGSAMVLLGALFLQAKRLSLVTKPEAPAAAISTAAKQKG